MNRVIEFTRKHYAVIQTLSMVCLMFGMTTLLVSAICGSLFFIWFSVMLIYLSGVLFVPLLFEEFYSNRESK